MSLVPEEQEPATTTEAPDQARATAGMKLDVIASLQADDIQKLIKILQGLAASRQEPTQQPTVHTATTLAEEEIRWEKMGVGRLPVSEDPQPRPPPTINPVITQPLARENPQSDPRSPPQVATFAEVCSQQSKRGNVVNKL